MKQIICEKYNACNGSCQHSTPHEEQPFCHNSYCLKLEIYVDCSQKIFRKQKLEKLKNI